MATPFAVDPSGSMPDNIAPGLQSEGQALQDEIRREKASLYDTLEAGIAESSLASLGRYLTTPEYEPEEGFDLTGRILHLDMALTQDELDSLMDNKAVSNQQFNDQIERLKLARNNMRDMGDNAFTGFATQVLDPGWLGVSILGGPAAIMARTARLVRTTAGMRGVGAGTSGLASVGLGAVQSVENPNYGTADLLVDSITNAIGGGFITRGMARAHDARWPTKELKDLRDSIPPNAKPTEARSWVQKTDADGNPVYSASGKPVYTQVSKPEVVDLTPQRTLEVNRIVDEVAMEGPGGGVTARRADPFKGSSGRVYEATDTTSVMQRLLASADPIVARMAKHLQDKAGPLLASLRVFHLSDDDLARASASGNPRYLPGHHQVLISDSTSDGIVLHEISHGATAAKINYGIANPDSMHGKITRELEHLRRLAKAEAEKINEKSSFGQHFRDYLTKDVHEFVAGLYSGDTSFLRMLANMKAPAYRSNVLSAAFKSIRRLLGFSVSEESALAQAMKLTDELLDLPVSQKMLDDSAVTWMAKGEDFGRTSVDGAMEGPVNVIGKATQQKDSVAKQLGMKLGWNLHKTMAKWNKAVADLFVDDPTNMTGNSIESQRRAIRADFSAVQYAFEDALVKAMAIEGAGMWARMFQQPKAMRIQAAIERDVYIELMQRSDAERLGRPHKSTAPAHIQEIADRMGDIAETALAEQKRAGVLGADAIKFDRNYVSRRWEPAKMEAAIAKLEAAGKTRKEARRVLVNMVAGAARRASGFDADTAQDVAAALVDRALRKGEFSDSAFRSHVGNEAVAEVRDILKQYGLPPQRLNRALEVITGVTDEAGKAPSLKHRVDLDMRTSLRMPDGSLLMLYDLMDTGIARITDRYLDGAAARSAYARKGLRTPSDVAAKRQELINSIPAENQAARADAARLFDDLVNFQNGREAGEHVPQMMRMMADMTQMVALQSSGLWQITEYATIMQRYGLGATLGYFLRTMPGFRELSSVVKSRETATSLASMLTRQSSQDIRLRPFINRLEDNFEFNLDSGMDVAQAVLKNSKQWVPYMNGMKYIHHHQAQMTANLIVDTLSKASSGNARSVRLLAQYGLEGHTLDRIAKEIAAKGHDTSAWSDDVWELARGPLTKMMDDAVLRARVGEVPAFAQFSSLGKFLFTFRSFVLAAHNKLLAGTLARDHLAGLSLMVLYQYPLALLATQANEVIRGREPVEGQEWVNKAVSQMGAFGGLTEIFGLVTGDKQQFGTPGFIALDRAWKLGGSIASGDGVGIAEDALNLLPIASLNPVIQAIRNNLD